MYQSIPVENTNLAGLQPPPTVRALLLDDSSFDRARIRRLSRKAEVPILLDEIGSLAELDQAVHDESYDLILIDYRLPVGDGMQALDTIQRAPKNRNAGKIMITGDNAVDTAVRAMRGGCHDFLTKSDMNAELLNKAMQNAMTLARERVMSLADYQREMIRQGLLDALKDDVVTENVVDLVAKQMMRPRHTPSDMDPGDLDALLASYHEEDEFLFH